jgi:hypothetical protein
VKYRFILACWLLVWSTAAAWSAPAASRTTVSLDFRKTPLSQALGILFQQIDAQYSLGSDVVDSIPISLRVKDMPFETALRTVLRLANEYGQGTAVNFPQVTYTKTGDMYHVHARRPTSPPGSGGGQPAGISGGVGFGGGGIGGGFEGGGTGGFGGGGLGGAGGGGPFFGGFEGGLNPGTAQVEKVTLGFLRPNDAITYLSQQPLTGIVSMQPLARENALIVRGDPDGIQSLKQTLKLADVPARPLSVNAGISGPGINGTQLAVRSTARTLVGDELVIDEQSVISGQPAHMKVTLRTQLLGTGELQVTSNWDVMVPVAGGAKGPIRLVKRLSTTTQIAAGQQVPVAEVDLAGWGGKGILRLWLQGQWGNGK